MHRAVLGRHQPQVPGALVDIHKPFPAGGTPNKRLARAFGCEGKACGPCGYEIAVHFQDIVLQGNWMTRMHLWQSVCVMFSLLSKFAML